MNAADGPKLPQRSRNPMPNKPHDSDVAFIKALAEVLNDNELTELAVKRDYGENDSLNVKVSRRQDTVAQVSAPATAPAASAAAPAAPAAAPADNAPVEDPASHPGAVTSPMVGTVYIQAEPGAPSFVDVGDKVAEGDTL